MHVLPLVLINVKILVVEVAEEMVQVILKAQVLEQDVALVMDSALMAAQVDVI